MQISIIIPVYNNLRFLRAAVCSALLSTNHSLEVVVVDDGSTEPIHTVISDLPVVFIREERCQGSAAARNIGLSAASGEFVCFLDSDDLLVPMALDSLMARMINDPTIDAVQGAIAELLIESDAPITSDIAAMHAYQCRPDSINSASKRHILNLVAPLAPCLFRASSLEKPSVFDESLKISEDLEFLLRYVNKRSILCVNHKTSIYRLHSKNKSKIGQDLTKQEAHWLKAERVLIEKAYIESDSFQ